jgi:hypothetical protein
VKFVNTSGFDLDFVLADKRYQVPPHETIDVPDRYAYAVAKHGLPLTPDGDVPPMGGAKPKAAVAPTVVDDENGDDPPPFSEPSPTDVGTEPPAGDDQGEDAVDESATEVEDDDSAIDAPTDVGTEPPADASAPADGAPRLTKKQRRALAAGK